MDSSTRTPQQPPKPRRLIDNVAEVRRRKEAAERLIRERHEALRRQHEEKIMKINEERQRQQRELKERHAKELKRQQDVLQRRMALMERDNARKKEILEKNHAAASRLSNNSSRKNYAFGSSTPRELSFLESRHLKVAMQEKRQSPEKQNASNGSVNGARKDRSSVLTSSMYVPSNSDRVRQASSVTRLANPKSTPTKQQNLMTQSVYSSSSNSSVTPITRLRRKPLSQLTTSVPNTPLSSGARSEVQKKQLPKAKPKGLPTAPANSKKETPTSKQSKSVSELVRRESLLSNETHSSIGARTTDSPFLDSSSVSDEVPVEMPELESHSEAHLIAAEPQHEEITNENGDESHNHSEPEEMPVLSHAISKDDIPPSDAAHHEGQGSEEEPMQRTVHEENRGDQEIVAQLVTIPDVDANKVVSEFVHTEMASALHTESGASLADELAGMLDAPPMPSPVSVVDTNNAEAVSPSPQPLVEIEENEHKEDVGSLNKGMADETTKESFVRKEAEEDRGVRDAAKPFAGMQEAETVDSSLKEVDTPPKEAVDILSQADGVADASPKEGGDASPNEIDAQQEVQTSPKETDASSIKTETSPRETADTSTEGSAESAKVATDAPQKTDVDHTTNELQLNGIEKRATAVITELPGTVPIAKPIDDSVVKKIPSPPNEFIAHRLRREQEQRELDERKARIAAILAKSRDLSNATTPLVAGRTSPPRSESAQDVLKRLASNGNLPALQKLVARHASGTATIEQFSAPEDPAPQAI